MKIQEVIARFNTTPFLFAGSGITRRYYSLPDWKGLLSVFAEMISKDRFAYRAYEERAKLTECPEGVMPKIATLLERDFNEKWFADVEGIRSKEENVLIAVENGASPFKAEVASYIQKASKVNEAYLLEIGKLRNISKKNISGIITTNYDSFFEEYFEDYRTFVGQKELVFSTIQGVAEIYKIHGSIMKPESLVITEEDYAEFRKKSKYLAAKLMTIFMEYPIVFIGYSLNDSNIQAVLEDIIDCVPEHHIPKLQNRFIFVEYKPGINCEISTHSMNLHGQLLEMTKITLDDFGILYDALAAKKASLPVKILRHFKEELYTFAITNEPGPMMKVAPLGDGRIDENMLALTIGLAQTGVYGLARLIDSDSWYENIVLGNLTCSADDLLEYVYPDLKKQNSAKLPICKYLSMAETDYPEIEQDIQQYSQIVTENALNRNKTTTQRYSSALDLWNSEKGNPNKAIRLLGSLPRHKVSAEDFDIILKEIFKKDERILKTLAGPERSNLRKIIRIYDLLKWGMRTK